MNLPIEEITTFTGILTGLVTMITCWEIDVLMGWAVTWQENDDERKTMCRCESRLE